MKKIEKLIESNNWKERLIGVRLAPIELVLQIAMYEMQFEIIDLILQILEDNKNLDIVKNAYSELANSSSSIIREFVAQNAELELVLEMAKNELNYDVCEVIVRRLEENKNLDIVKNAYSKLANVYSLVICIHVAENAELELVLQMAANNKRIYEDVCEVIVKRLEENKDLGIVKESYSKLANSDCYLIREFVAENAELELVLKMAKVESYNVVCKIIVKRLKENKDLDIVKNAYSELANSYYNLIREFVAENAELELVLQMSKNESDYDVCKVIVRRLEENKDLDIVKNSYSKLANAFSSVICIHVAENAELGLVLQMAANNEKIYKDVFEVIVNRLEENKDLDIVKESYSKLANSSSAVIRKFVAKNSKFKLVLQMARTEFNNSVCEVIVKRLEENKDLDIVKNSYIELTNSNCYRIREFVVENSTLDILQKVIKEERLLYVRIIDLMYCNSNYINATPEEKLSLLKNIPSKYLTNAVKYERDEKILLWIYKKIK